MPSEPIKPKGEPVAEVTLTGKHVQLVPLREAHAEEIFAAVSTGAPIGEQFPFTWVPTTRELLREWMGYALETAKNKQAVAFVTLDRRDGAIVGSTRFFNIEHWGWPLKAANPEVVEIGWTWLAPRAMRTPINTEAKLLMLTHAFEVWGVLRVTLKTDARNQRSRSAIARIGAVFEGVLRSHQPASDGGVRDTAMFSIVRSEWPAVKAALQDRLARSDR